MAASLKLIQKDCFGIFVRVRITNISSFNGPLSPLFYSGFSYKTGGAGCFSLLTKSRICCSPLSPSGFPAKHQTRLVSSKPWFSDTAPVLWTEDLLIRIHDATGCPWWLTISLLVFSLRSLTTFPLAIYQSYILAKYENLTPEILELRKELLKETAIAKHKLSLSEAQAKYLFRRSLKKQITKLIIRDNCHPFKGTLSIFFQVPVWICVSASLRNMCVMLPAGSGTVVTAYQQLVVEGTLWFTNLTALDHTLTIPILLGIVNLAVIEFNALRHIGPQSRLKRWATNFFRCFCVMLVPFAALLPSCISFYWLNSSLFGLGQNIVILAPKLRRFFRIPKSPSEKEKPFSVIKNNIKDRFRWKKIG